jgi:hypothetical protein
MKHGYKFMIADKQYLTSFEIPKNLEMFDQRTQQKIKNLYETSKKNRNF